MSKNYTFGDFRKKEKEKEADQAPDLITKTDDQRRPLDDQTTSDIQTGRPLVDQKKLVVQSKLVDQKEANYPTRFERDKIGLRLPKDKVTKYKTWCFLNGISLQDAVEKAMDMLLVDQSLTDDQQKLVDQTTRRPLDLDIRRSDLDKDHPDPDNLSYTIEEYKKWTGNNFNSYDHQYFEHIKDVGKEDIRLGIMTSVAGCKTPVGTFKYCIKAIRQSTTIKNKIIQEQQILELLQKRGITIK